MPLRQPLTYLIVLAFLAPFSTSGQGKLKAKLAANEAKKQQAFAEGRPWLSPLIAPAYTADAGFLISGGLLYSFKLNKQDSLSQRSSIPFTVYYSTRGNLGIRAFPKTFWLADKLRANAEISIRDKDNNYFGKGFKQIDQTRESDSTTLYHETSYMIDMDITYRIRPSLYVGIRLKPSYINTQNFALPVEQDPYRSRFADSYFLSGIGTEIAYDTRDIVVNAWRGLFLSFSTLFFDGLWGSKYDYQEFKLDARFYRTISRPGNVLAFRSYLRSTYGDVPITELADFSGSKMLRGYLMGHYRDNTTAFVLGEWRRTFQKSNGKLSKSGMVLWLGAGSIAPDVVSLRKWVPNIGAGYRFELQPRMNVCIDFGMGKDTKGVYFNINESF